MTTQTATPIAAAPLIAERSRVRSLCLVVHDELEFRLPLAGLLRKVMPTLDADTVTSAGFQAISIDRIRAYSALMFIMEFSPPEAAAASLAALARLHAQLPEMPLFVFARGGNESTAAKAMKLGARYYWPIHSVIVTELRDELTPIIEPAAAAAGISRAAAAAADRWRQPQIAGYTLLKRIAQSALAGVYLARNDEFSQPVALKMLAIKGTALDRLRFERECEILSKLNHRSVANILDYGITAEYLYLALEYFPCGSLRDRLKNPVSAVDAVNYARQIGEALQIVHAAHIVHRDLKPSNLMLTDDNRLVLIDFGSARTRLKLNSVSDDDDRTGTPYYACPEQTEEREPDARGDLYSLGVVFFEMLSGRVPFAGKNVPAILAAHRDDAIPRLREGLRSFQPIIDRLLAKNPNDRYASAAQFLAAMDAAKPHGALDS